MVRTLGGDCHVRCSDVVLAQLFNTRADNADGRPPWDGRHAYVVDVDVGGILRWSHGIVGRHRGSSPFDTVPVQNARVVGKGRAGCERPQSPRRERKARCLANSQAIRTC